MPLCFSHPESESYPSFLCHPQCLHFQIISKQLNIQKTCQTPIRGANYCHYHKNKINRNKKLLHLIYFQVKLVLLKLRSHPTLSPHFHLHAQPYVELVCIAVSLSAQWRVHYITLCRYPRIFFRFVNHHKA